MGRDRDWSGYLLTRRETLLGFGGIALGMFLAAINQTIVATALPHIISDLAGLDDYTAVFTAYMLAMTVTVPIWGRLSDIHGRRPFFLAGIVILGAGSAIAASATSIEQLIAGRFVQGVGGGALIPLALAIIGDLVPPSKRGRWHGIYGGVVGAAAVLGPVVGGWIADHADWRWVFLISLVLCLPAFAVVAVTLKLPTPKGRAARVDYLGAALLTGALVALLLGILEAGKRGGVTQAQPVALLVVGLALLAALIRHERRAPAPFLPVDLLDDRLVRTVGAAVFALGTAVFTVTMFVPLFAQGALGVSATVSGLVLMPFLVSMVLVTVASGHAIAHTGRYRWAIVSGPPLVTAGFVFLVALDEGSAPVSVSVALVILGVGVGLGHQNLLLVIQNATSSRHLGLVTSGTHFCRTTGGTLGVALMGAVLSAGVAMGSIGSGAGGAPHVLDGSLSAREALAQAMDPVFVIAIVLMLLTSWLVLRIPELALRPTILEEHGRDATPAA